MSISPLAGGSRAYAGNTINIMQNKADFVEVLPRLISDIKILIIRPTWKTLDGKPYEVSREKCEKFKKFGVSFGACTPPTLQNT